MTPKEEKKLNKVMRIDKYPNVAIVEEIEKAQYEELKDKFEKKK